MRATRHTGVVAGRAAAALAGLITTFSAFADVGELPKPLYRGSGNYLVVMAPQYQNTAPMNLFIATKSGQGFNVMTYVVSVGQTNAQIRNYIRTLWGTPNAPDYILLVGDTAGESATLNTVPHWVGQASRHATSDLYYGCMDAGDDWYPEIPVGRFSVTSVTMLNDVMLKSLFVEAGDFADPDYVKRAAFLATGDMTAGAEETHNFVIDNYLTPAEFSCTRIYARLGGGTTDITNAVNNGCLFVTYGGHSGSGGWSSPAFNQDNVRALTNNGLYGLVFGWSCNTAHFSYDECFGETWQRVSRRGAAAYLSASDYIFWGSWEAWEPFRQLERYFFQAIFVDGIWEVGPAWQAALYDLLADYGSVPGHEDVTRNCFEEFVLLGDPALHLPEGIGFTLTVTPESHALCSPPAEQAVYTIEVEQTMGFSEAVTLSVDGLPPGATVDFSVNGIPPPFTSVMTVGDLSGGSPGDYTLEITGTASSLTRTKLVGLHLSDTPPGDVTLVSPPDGASDVARRPTLTWQAASQAVEYDLEIARDAGFSDVVLSATVAATSFEVGINLDPATLHYWHVRARNGCGEGEFSTAFRFTTIEQADYFTEEFGADFDLEYKSVTFTPDGSGDYYDICIEPATALPVDPNAGIPIAPGEDGYVLLSLTGGQTVSLYGQTYSSFYVNSNGNITFGSGDGTWQVSLAAHFSRPRIAALFDDLSPQYGGTDTWQQLADRAVVTFQNAPEYGTGNSNTFQFELFFDGRIRITWLQIDATNNIAGLSAGEGIPVDYLESDLSAAGPCGPDFDLEVEPESLAVCAPADAVYTVHVVPSQGFTAPVTLSASGQPPGTTVGFSVNPVTPPGSSLMTISGTGNAPAGAYIIEVTGVGGGVQQSRLAYLNLNDDVPATVALTAPPDGAIEVPLRPTLEWQAADQALTYDVQVATDIMFNNVVFSATVTDTSVTPDSDLPGARLLYWHVRGVNACGVGHWSAPFHFVTINRISPTAYDMLNGQTGTYTYFDDTYDGEGNVNEPLAPLSGGLGDLTDGVIATAHWNVTPLPYVGWVTVDPTITFHFDGQVLIERVILYLDDAGGGGGVHVPEDVTLVMGDDTLVFDVTDPPGDGPFPLVLEDLELAGDTLAVTLADHSTSGYMMLSEVEFYGQSPYVPCPGDLDGDNDVDLADLSILLAHYGTTGGAEYEDGDLDFDGDVDLGDLSALLAAYGTTCP